MRRTRFSGVGVLNNLNTDLMPRPRHKDTFFCYDATNEAVMLAIEAFYHLLPLPPFRFATPFTPSCSAPVVDNSTSCSCNRKKG